MEAVPTGLIRSREISLRKCHTELTLLIEDKLESKTPCNNAPNPVEQVLIDLRYYAVAYMQLAIADLFDASQLTVCRVVHRVSEAIASLLPDFIHLPVNREEC
ncbi:nuclease HARBI1 [Trichonephila clavipes]|uniref:Nuclease HARBI1 n=1 Tax=Trichonephila clavipes TaxID=2585209 RepID=A0A8X6RDD8_TRICX|nr:nuclease HARBI1 [Trichonephila clavipes]